MESSVIASFITLGGGLLIFAGTQWILHCRAVTDFQRAKLEELCAVYIAVQKHTVEWRIAHVERDNTKWGAILMTHGDHLIRINLLTALYFRDNVDFTERFVNAAHPRNFMRYLEMDHPQAVEKVNDMLTRAAQAWQNLVMNDADFTRARFRHRLPRWAGKRDAQIVARIVRLLPLPPLSSGATPPLEKQSM